MGPETPGGNSSLDLSGPAIAARLDRMRAELLLVVARDHADAPYLRDLVDRLTENGRIALGRLAADGEAADVGPASLTAALEVIVREDGTRPAFQIVNGRPRPGADANDRWYLRLANNDAVTRAVAAVGRINDPGTPGPGYHGTGFLVAPDLVITNRHVAQAIAPLASPQHVVGGVVPVHSGIFFDHGHELGGVESAGRRPVREVVFAGPRVIEGTTPLDHTRLDLAVLRLGAPLDPGGPRVTPLEMAIDTSLTDRQEEIVVVGYPARPSAAVVAGALDDPAQALTLIYQNRFGYKRAAPGEIVRSPGEAAEDTKGWRVDHDASTLGGNSGSCVVDLEFAPRIVALHYGGEWFGGVAARINWAHALRKTLDEPGLGGLKFGTLREVAAAEGIVLAQVS